ncbi:hypothetical protein ACLOJK_003447 [Asimina triloba]
MPVMEEVIHLPKEESYEVKHREGGPLVHCDVGYDDEASRGKTFGACLTLL